MTLWVIASVLGCPSRVRFSPQQRPNRGRLRASVSDQKATSFLVCPKRYVRYAASPKGEEIRSYPDRKAAARELIAKANESVVWITAAKGTATIGTMRGSVIASPRFASCSDDGADHHTAILWRVFLRVAPLRVTDLNQTVTAVSSSRQHARSSAGTCRVGRGYLRQRGSRP